MHYLHHRSIAFLGMLIFTCAIPAMAQSPEQLSEEQMSDFLLHAKVIAAKRSSKGITGTHRLTLQDGTIVHDASFQSIDEFEAFKKFDNGRTEMNFRDCYKYNIAAYEVAKLLDIGDMMPVTVERKWEGRKGSLSWWLSAKMDEGQRREKHIEPPDPEFWAKQVHKMRVFSQLVYDTDRNNPGNQLISADWHLWMIDFSRAFRLFHDLEDQSGLTRCDRRLFQKLGQLERTELKRNTKNLLTNLEIDGIMARRDKIVAHFKELIAQKGEAAVLYD